MKNKFIIWGTGKYGVQVCNNIGKENVLGFIDSDICKKNQKLFGKLIHTYEECRILYPKSFILVAINKYEAVEEKLISKSDYRYFILRECPQEIFKPNLEFAKKYLINAINWKLPSVIYGINFFSIWLWEICLENKINNVTLVPDGNWSRERRKVIRELLGESYKEQLEYNCTEKNILYTHKIPAIEYSKKNHIYNIHELGFQIPEYENKAIADLKDKHIGETTFIVATGPSLCISDLDTLYRNKIKCISMNKIFYSFDKTKWRPEYYMVEDQNVIQQNLNSILKVPNEVRHVFMVENGYAGEIPKVISQYHLGLTNSLDEFPSFSNDASRVIYWGGTITYACIQLAVYLGFKKIYLLGVDADYSKIGQVGGHFYEKEDSQFFKPAEIESLKAYNRAKQFAEEHGIKIFNATRGGKLEIFERANFDELFNK